MQQSGESPIRQDSSFSSTQEPELGTPFASSSPVAAGMARPGIDPSLSSKISNISFLLVFFVVLIHSQTHGITEKTNRLNDAEMISSFIQLTISEGFARVAVPIFFAISGFLFFQGYNWRFSFFRRKISSRLVSLLIPYLVWSGFWMACYFVLQSFPQTRPYCKTTIIKDMSLWDGLKTLTLDPIPVQIWYVRDLFLLCLLTPLLGPLIKYLPIPTLMVFFWAWIFDVVFLPTFRVNMPVLNSEGLLFFSIGGILALREVRWKIEKSTSVIFLWVALCLLCAGLFLADPSSRWITPLRRIGILVGIAAVWWGDWRLLGRRVRSYWCSATTSIMSCGVFIFFAHVPLITFINKRLLTLFAGPWSSLLSYFLGFTLTVAVCLIAGIFLKKVAPSFYRLLTGGRF